MSAARGHDVDPQDPPLRVEILVSDFDSFKLELRRDPVSGEAASLATYKLLVDAGSAGREEHEGLTLKRGRNNIATKVNAASKLIKIEDTGGSLPE